MRATTCGVHEIHPSNPQGEISAGQGGGPVHPRIPGPLRAALNRNDSHKRASGFFFGGFSAFSTLPVPCLQARTGRGPRASTTRALGGRPHGTCPPPATPSSWAEATPLAAPLCGAAREGLAQTVAELAGSLGQGLQECHGERYRNRKAHGNKLRRTVDARQPERESERRNTIV